MNDNYCGHQIPPDEPRVRLVDELGSHDICGLHAIGLLTQASNSVEVTLMLTTPVTQAVT